MTTATSKPVPAQEILDRAIKGCAFCGKSAREVRALVEGVTGARICNECVPLAVALLAARESR